MPDAVTPSITFTQKLIVHQSPDRAPTAVGAKHTQEVGRLIICEMGLIIMSDGCARL